MTPDPVALRDAIRALRRIAAEEEAADNAEHAAFLKASSSWTEEEWDAWRRERRAEVEAFVEAHENVVAVNFDADYDEVADEMAELGDVVGEGDLLISVDEGALWIPDEGMTLRCTAIGVEGRCRRPVIDRRPDDRWWWRVWDDRNMVGVRVEDDPTGEVSRRLVAQVCRRHLDAPERVAPDHVLIPWSDLDLDGPPEPWTFVTRDEDDPCA